MECPKCGEDNLMGARKCMSCGADMFGDLAPPPQVAAPPPQDAAPDLAEAFPGMVAPQRPPPPPIPTDGSAPHGASGMETAICATCMEKFERFAGDSAKTCMTCRAAALSAPAVTASGGAGSDDAGVVQFGQRMGTSAFRPPPMKKKKNFNFTPLLILIVLGAGGWFGWQHFQPEEDRTRDLLSGLTAEAATLVTAPKEDVKLDTVVLLQIVREAQKADFATAEKVVDARVEISLSADVEFVRDDERGPVIEVFARCSTPQQTGTVPGGKLNPWDGHAGSERMALLPRGAPAILGAAGAVVGKDVPPLFSLGMIEAPPGPIAPGATWKGDVTLPLFTDEGGRLVAADFPCEFEYVGTGDRRGYRCVGIHVRGRAPTGPPPGTGKLTACSARIRAALFYALDTGLLVECTLDADVRGDGGDAAAMHVKGTLSAARR